MIGATPHLRIELPGLGRLKRSILAKQWRFAFDEGELFLSVMNGGFKKFSVALNRENDGAFFDSIGRFGNDG